MQIRPATNLTQRRTKTQAWLHCRTFRAKWRAHSREEMGQLRPDQLETTSSTSFNPFCVTHGCVWFSLLYGSGPNKTVVFTSIRFRSAAFPLTIPILVCVLTAVEGAGDKLWAAVNSWFRCVSVWGPSAFIHLIFRHHHPVWRVKGRVKPPIVIWRTFLGSKQTRTG